MEGRAKRLDHHRRFQCADASRLYPAYDGGLAKTRRNRLRAADRLGPDSLAAEMECAFLNTYEARWQYAADACGLGFAQGKSMLWRRDVLEAAAGSNDSATRSPRTLRPPSWSAAHACGRASLQARSISRSADGVGPKSGGGRRAGRAYAAPLSRCFSRRNCSLPDCWRSSRRPSARRRSASRRRGSAAAVALIWYGSEAALALLAGWRLAPATLVAFVVRDATLPWLWLQAWMVDDFEWRGHAMSTADEAAPPAH